MKFIKEYKQIKNNYRCLGFADKVILWLEFKTKPIDKLLKIISCKGKFLDLGCGHGALSYFFAEKYPDLEIIAIDPVAERIRIAEAVFSKPANLHFRQGKIEDLNEEGFNTTLLADVDSYVTKEELIRMLKICYEKTKKGGVLIIKTMNKAHFLKYLLTVLTSILLTETVLISNFFFRRANLKKIFGSRQKLTHYYYPEEFRNLLEKTGWQVKIYDIPPKFFIFPHIIYLCQKK